MVIHQCGVDCGCDGVDLRCISGSEHSQYTESSEKIGQKMPFFAETVFDVIHRSADEFPVGIFLVIENSQCYLGKFRTHAEQSGNPHPEYGAGSADSDSAGNTGNITGTNRGSKCCTDRLERCNCAIGSISFAEHSSKRCADRIREFSNLEKTGAQTQVKADTENTDHSRNTPDKIVHGIVDGFNQLEHRYLFLFHKQKHFLGRSVLS